MRFINNNKPGEALPNQVFQVVAKSNQEKAAHFVYRPDHREHSAVQ